MFTFSAFLCKICFEHRVPHTNILRCIKQRIAQISGAPFLHLCVRGCQLSGLVSRRRKSGIGQKLIRRGKAIKVTYLCDNDGCHTGTHSGDVQHPGRVFIQKGKDLRFDLVDFLIQKADVIDRVAQFKRFCWR